MKTGAVILGMSVSAVLLGALGVLYILAENNQGQEYRKSIELVRQIQLLSSEWNVELNRVRSNPVVDFDSLAAFIPRMARFKTNLFDTVSNMPDLPDRLANNIRTYFAAIEAKEERIERFKASYTIVRNSKHYLPLAVANVLKQVQNSQNSALVQKISNLIRDVNLYLVAPTQTSEARLATEVRDLQEGSVVYPTAIANALANLLSHIEVLINMQKPTEELFQQATSNEIFEITDQVSKELEFELGKRLVLSTYYQRGIMAMIIVLILFWVFLALHQRIRPRPAGAEALPSPNRVTTGASNTGSSDADKGGSISKSGATTESPILGSILGESNNASDVAAALTVGPFSTTEQTPLGVAESAKEPAVFHGFIVQCVAGIIASSAEEIGERMDYLNRTQERILEAIRHRNAIAGETGDSDIEEGIETISNIASSVDQKMNTLADLAKRLQLFSKSTGKDLERSMVDINSCVEHVAKTAEATGEVTILRELGDIPEVFASRIEVCMLLERIVENSMLGVQDREEKNKGLVKIDTVRKGDEILITIIDNGTGISPDLRMNLFKPFYTSREGALGIGLTLAGHLIKKYDGVIKINSLHGQGTVARITLPSGSFGS